jgi:uncharacterized protein (TIGR00255 family)
MTGYAYTEKTYDNLSASIEIKGYNNRYLELNISVPHGFSKFESEIRVLASEYCNRGKIEINLRVKERDLPFVISLNKTALSSYINAAQEILQEATSIKAASIKITNSIDISHLITLDGILNIEKQSTHGDSEKWDLLKPMFSDAFKMFDNEKKREGEYTENAILGFVDILENGVKQISCFASKMDESIKENIKNRFKELKIDGIDENRILAEVAMLLIKYTIAEEITRLNSHLSEFKAEAKRNQNPGKKLDFLSQEISREINTIGSKSTMVEISKTVVDMKDALENIREQLRNVE